MINIKKTSSDILRKKLQKINRLENGGIKFYEKARNFDTLAFEIRKELDKRNRAAIFKMACKVLKNCNCANQFQAAAQYADAVVNSSNYFSDDDHHEIGSFYTKSKHPEVVYF